MCSYGRKENLEDYFNFLARALYKLAYGIQILECLHDLMDKKKCLISCKEAVSSIAYGIFMAVKAVSSIAYS